MKFPAGMQPAAPSRIKRQHEHHHDEGHRHSSGVTNPGRVSRRDKTVGVSTAATPQAEGSPAARPSSVSRCHAERGGCRASGLWSGGGSSRGGAGRLMATHLEPTNEEAVIRIINGAITHPTSREEKGKVMISSEPVTRSDRRS